jgi:predicted porin
MVDPDRVTDGVRTGLAAIHHYNQGHHRPVANCALAEDGAKMWALGYNYSLSKRTSVGVTYAQISNDTGRTYTPFTGNGSLGLRSSHALAAKIRVSGR